MKQGKITAKELRYQTSPLLRRVMAGERLTVTLRGKPIAVLGPVSGPAADRFEPIAFGLWKKRGRKEPVQKWLDQLRRPRHR
jgi:prevent-host-death family protein